MVKSYSTDKKFSRWVNHEITFIKKNQKHMRNSDIAHVLRRTPASIAQKKYGLGLMKSKKWSKDEVIRNIKITANSLGRSPAEREIEPKMYQACIRHFGSFNSAKLSAGFAIRKHENRIENHQVSREFLYVLGAVSGDGHVRLYRSKSRTSGQVILKVKDKDFSGQFKSSLEKWSGCNASLVEMPNGFYLTTLSSLSAAEIIRNFDLNEVLSMSLELQLSFAGGLFDSEGGVVATNLNQRKNAKRWIHFYNSDRNIIHIVNTILNKIGIKHSIRSRVHSGFGSKRVQYEVLIYGKQNLMKFWGNIGFSILRKQKNLEDAINSYGVKKYGEKTRSRL